MVPAVYRMLGLRYTLQRWDRAALIVASIAGGRARRRQAERSIGPVIVWFRENPGTGINRRRPEKRFGSGLAFAKANII